MKGNEKENFIYLRFAFGREEPRSQGKLPSAKEAEALFLTAFSDHKGISISCQFSVVGSRSDGGTYWAPRHRICNDPRVCSPPFLRTFLALLFTLVSPRKPLQCPGEFDVWCSHPTHASKNSTKTPVGVTVRVCIRRKLATSVRIMPRQEAKIPSWKTWIRRQSFCC